MVKIQEELLNKQLKSSHYQTIKKLAQGYFFHAGMSNEVAVIVANDRSSRPEVFCKKGVLKNLVKSTGKHLCKSLFLINARG